MVVMEAISLRSLLSLTQKQGLTLNDEKREVYRCQIKESVGPRNRPIMPVLPKIIDSVQCPECNGESKVIDSRDVFEARRRRRECLRCKHRYSTYEIHAEHYNRVVANLAQVDSIMETLRAKVQPGDSNGHRQE
jgi:hypothetical protein